MSAPITPKGTAGAAPLRGAPGAEPGRPKLALVADQAQNFLNKVQPWISTAAQTFGSKKVEPVSLAFDKAQTAINGVYTVCGVAPLAAAPAAEGTGVIGVFGGAKALFSGGLKPADLIAEGEKLYDGFTAAAAAASVGTARDAGTAAAESLQGVIAAAQNLR